jgi:hypothetical protein
MSFELSFRLDPAFADVEPDDQPQRLQVLARFPAERFGGFGAAYGHPVPPPEIFEGVFYLKRIDGDIRATFDSSPSHPSAAGTWEAGSWGMVNLDRVVALRSHPDAPWRPVYPGWQREVA